jgi:hypothetical protein
MSEDTGDTVDMWQTSLRGINWEPRCPICGQPDNGAIEFDFHHWDYDTDQGLQLCRKCHQHAHRYMTVRQQREHERVDDWKEDAARRMINRLERKRVTEPWSIARLNLPEEVDV